MKSLAALRCKLSADLLSVLHLSINTYTFYGFMKQKSLSMALVDRYPFGQIGVILAKVFIAVGDLHYICWLNLAHQWLVCWPIFFSGPSLENQRLTGEAESHPTFPTASPTLCPCRAVEKNTHSTTKNHARTLGGSHMVFWKRHGLF